MLLLFLAYLRRGGNFRKRIRKFGKRCFLDVRKRGEDNVYITVMEVTCLEIQVSSCDWDNTARCIVAINDTTFRAEDKRYLQTFRLVEKS